MKIDGYIEKEMAKGKLFKYQAKIVKIQFLNFYIIKKKKTLQNKQNQILSKFHILLVKIFKMNLIKKCKIYLKIIKWFKLCKNYKNYLKKMILKKCKINLMT